MRTSLDPRVARVLEEMDRRLPEPLAVADLAAGVGLGPSHLARLFRRHVGTTPTRYLRDLRLERARLLLARTSLSVRDVMRQVGWTDPGHFAREFRRRFGSPPRNWRSLSAHVPTRRGRSLHRPS